MIAPSLVRYILTAALRDKLFLAVLVLLAVMTSLSIMMASTAVTESDQFALVFTAGSLRLAGNMGLVLFVIFFIRRAFDAGDIDFILSRPITRPCFVLSHAVALVILSAIVSMFCLLALYLVAPHMFGVETLYWAYSYFWELVIISHAALFFSLMLSSVPSAAFAVLGLYVLGRLIGEMLGIVHSGELVEGLAVLGIVMEGISWLTPRLDLMAQSSWLIYGLDMAVGAGIILAQGTIFTGLLIAAAMIDLSKKEF